MLLLGEAPGEEEVRQRKPFVGPSGKFLDDILKISGLQRSDFHCTNVFSERPPNNDLKAWTLTKTELRKLGFSESGRLPPHSKRFLHPEREPELQRLQEELQRIKPEIIIALGGTALWALAGDSRITMHRGSFFQSKDGATALATFHPAAVLREWSMRPLIWADLTKVRRLLEGTLPPPVSRRLWINPTEQEIAHVYARFEGLPNDLLGVDIETSPSCGQITTFAIGTSAECICIPLWNKSTLPGLCNSYATLAGEVAAWQWIRRFCALPNPKVAQNGMYDWQWLLDVMDIRPVNILHDTAILQHSLQPELPKDLGTLGSIYLNEPAWKFMRESNKDDNKADE